MMPLDSNGTQCQGQAAQYEEVLSIRQHTSAYVSIRQRQRIPLDSDGSIRQHTSAYLYNLLHTQLCNVFFYASVYHSIATADSSKANLCSMRTRQHTSVYVSIRQHTTEDSCKEAKRHGMRRRCRVSHPWGFLKSECRFCSSLVLLWWVLSLSPQLAYASVYHYVSIRQLTTAYLGVVSLSSQLA